MIRRLGLSAPPTLTPTPTSGEETEPAYGAQPTTANDLINCDDVMEPPLETLKNGVQRASGW